MVKRHNAYFTRWLIVRPHSYKFMFFAKSYVFYKLHLYEWPTPNPAPKPTRHCGLDKSYKIVRVRPSELATS